MRVPQALVVAPVLLALALAGCGGDDGDGGGGGGAAPETEACAILANGNKLCGEDLATYCRGFATESQDLETSQACSAVNVDLSDPYGERARRERQQQEAREAVGPCRGTFVKPGATGSDACVDTP